MILEAQKGVVTCLESQSQEQHKSWPTIFDIHIYTSWGTLLPMKHFSERLERPLAIHQEGVCM